MKTCCRCLEVKPKSEYYNYSKTKDGLAYKCIPCTKLYLKEYKLKNPGKIKAAYERNKEKAMKATKKWIKLNPEKVKGYRLKCDYGIDISEYNRMRDEQGNVCAICKREETKRNGYTNKIITLCIDHDHKTGKIRGLLCHDCNIAIGRLRDDTEIVMSAFNYLQKFRV